MILLDLHKSSKILKYHIGNLSYLKLVKAEFHAPLHYIPIVGIVGDVISWVGPAELGFFPGWEVGNPDKLVNPARVQC